jgi:hypothetical protein
MALNPIPSTIPTSTFYQLALQALYDISAIGGDPIPAGTNVIGSVNLPTSATSSITSFTSTSSAQVLAANANRKGVVLYNQGAGTCFVLLGTGTTSASANSVGLGASDAVTITGWTGAIQGIFLTAGTLSVTELL